MQFLACQPSSSISFHFPSKTHIPVPPKTPPPTLRPLLPTSASSAPRRTHVLLSRPRARDADEASAGDADLELLGKPSSVRSNVSEGEEAVSEKEQEAEGRPRELEEALAPFVKFFKSRDAAESSSASAAVGNGEDDEDEEQEEEGSGLGASPDVREGEQVVKDENLEKVAVEYYDPKPGALVVGVVVSGNEHKIDVNVGADLLGTMLTKEVLPLHGGELANSSYDLDKDVEDLMLPGKIGIVKDDEALEVERVPGRPVVEVGTVLFAEVLGRNLSGRPLLSSRRMFRRVAWHRVKQIKQLNEPIEVRITEWNTGGLLTRIEGLRAFLPKAELMNRINNFTDLKENVGRRMHVCITKIDDANNDLIISERVAWDMQHLQEGTLLEGTVCKIFPFGAQVKIGETKRSGLLHISNITRARVESVGDLLKVDEKVKVLVLDSMFPEKISLSIADLESVPGLFISDKERVFSEAETMAKKYKRRLRAIPVYRKSSPLPQSTLPFDDESRLYSNWKWFKFDRDNGMV